MSNEKERVGEYLATIARLEPDISAIDASAFYASAAISLKRIADYLQPKTDHPSLQQAHDVMESCRAAGRNSKETMSALHSAGYRIVPL